MEAKSWSRLRLVLSCQAPRATGTKVPPLAAEITASPIGAGKLSILRFGVAHFASYVKDSRNEHVDHF
eukprot:6491066-Amphidinium_carterae.1